MGEEGTDTGGLTREFFRLICYSMGNQYLESTGCFRHDATAYQVQSQMIQKLLIMWYKLNRNEYIYVLEY